MAARAPHRDDAPVSGPRSGGESGLGLDDGEDKALRGGILRRLQVRLRLWAVLNFDKLFYVGAALVALAFFWHAWRRNMKAFASLDEWHKNGG
jgi:hypothetical protein